MTDAAGKVVVADDVGLDLRFRALALRLVAAAVGGRMVTVYPDGVVRPLASSINFAPGQTIANAVVAKVGAVGRVDIYNFQGTTHAVVDVQGWFGT